MRLINRIMTLVILLTSFHGVASLQPVTLFADRNLPSPRWMFDGRQRSRAYGTAKQLERLKRAQLAEKFKLCGQRAAALREVGSGLAPWVATVELNCLRRGVVKKEVGAGLLAQAIAHVENKSRWLLRGNHRELLREELIESRLLLFTKDFRRYRQRAWESIDQLLGMQEWMSVEQKTLLYKYAGDLAFIEQKMKAAKSFVLQSLELTDSEELREKLSSIEKALKSSHPGESQEEEVTHTKLGQVLEAHPEEEKLYQAIQDHLKSGSLLTAVEDSVRLISRFPGGQRAEWASDQILSAYRKTDTGRSASYFSEQSRMLRQMKKVDGLRLQKWARDLFSKGSYFAAKELALAANKNLKPASRSRKVLMLAGQAAIASGKTREASDIFRSLVKHHSGSKEALHASFRAGLAHFRLKEYEKAVTFFEKLLDIEDTENLELSARYWLWRSLQKLNVTQKLNSPRVEKARMDLVNRFPLTYYGLRALAEAPVVELQEETQEETQREASETPQTEEIEKEVKKTKTVAKKEKKTPRKTKEKKRTTVWLTSSQSQSWQRFLLLLQAGWLDEAQSELRGIGPIFSKTDQRIMAKVWGATFGYRQAISLANQATQMENRLESASYIDMAFPREFLPWIDREAKEHEVNKRLLQSLIRQESAYQIRAISRSNAMGLMQLLPSTAAEVAQRLGVKDFSVEEDLMKPKTNIRLGTYYLAQMLKSFKSHVPLALAAYNAGPTRLRRWLSGRGLLEKLTENLSSTPESEIWVEEMPWSETRFYVKAILRNYIVYGGLDEERVQLSDPIWQ